MSFLACCVPGCSSRFPDGPPLHRFPNPDKDPQHFRSWVMNIGGDIVGLDEHFVCKNRRVCQKHFPKNWHYLHQKSIVSSCSPHVTSYRGGGSSGCRLGGTGLYGVADPNRTWEFQKLAAQDLTLPVCYCKLADETE